MAQAYAEECAFRVNANRVNLQSTFSSVGENIAVNVLPSILLNYTSMVKQWNDEVEDYNYVGNSCTSPGECSRYTQVSKAYALLSYIEKTYHAAH